LKDNYFSLSGQKKQKKLIIYPHPIDLSPNPSPGEGGASRTRDKVPLSPGRGGFRGRGHLTMIR
jgi:hypothetical protein